MVQLAMRWTHDARRGTGRPVALFAVELFVGLMAVPCGILLAVNGLGMPRDVLADSPFDSFVIPGLILTAVGATLLGAAWAVWTRHPRAQLASIGARCVLLGWIVVEAAMVSDGRDLQLADFAAAVLTIGLAWRFWWAAAA